MRLTTKLVLSFAGIIALLLLMSGVSFKSVSGMNASVTSVDTDIMPSVVAVQGMQVNFWSIRSNLSAMLLARDVSRVGEYEKRMTDILAQIKKGGESFLDTLDAFPPQEAANAKALLDKINATSDKMGVARKKLTDVARSGDFDGAYRMFADQYRPLFNEMIPVYAEIVAQTTGSTKKLVERAVSAGNSAKITAVVLSLAAIAISIVITWLLTRSVGAQLGKDPGELQQIAQRVVQGDYNVDDGSAKRGVYAAIVEMVHALKEHIEQARLESEKAREQSEKATEAMRRAEAAGADAQAKTEAMLHAATQLEQVAQVVSSASTQLSAQIEQSDRSAHETSQRLGEAATAMNEMNATVQEVAKNAGAASSASAETKAKAEAGASIVQNSLESINAVHQVSLELKDDMTELNEHAQAINRIMGVISDIADQTNLLALNAAIEAARAGEAGRGFAVVADEVRKLAEKTMASTNDVGSAIKSIQESTAKSLDSMDKAVEQVNRATDYANQSGTALQEIVTTVESTADQVNAIATASEEQSAASEEINHTITQVNDMSQQTAEAMSEAAKAVSDLAAQAQRLTELIAGMRQG
ncbi:methyl-accepting chemotaxis protein [Desulfovibrio legallii]|uniref:Methyl-accepting chemotaxis protein n=1 Tax=Desulfovibrio legallii TaxID=571438 RepID=A0A1G7MJP2_9BACT|nr:methyl-accepting chemotaxis protein [Desulfovibrio legallii]SDF62108.1 methyl-accepting chemotaxis protein [Desulfovibrio legallii]